MAWIESHADLRDHPKLDHLMELLGLTRRDATGLLHFVWWRALTYAPSGDLSGFTDGQIARWADWEGDPAMLVEALTAAGFLDDRRVLHDWHDYAGRWIERREMNAARMRQARATRNGTAAQTHVQATCAARGLHVQGLPDLTGPDLTGPDLTGTTPQPPPQAEGERPKRRRRRDEPVEIPLTPLVKADEQRWSEALDQLQRYVMPALFSGVVSKLRPVGRAPDGGLCLRAPPSIAGDARGIVGAVGRALEQVGDAAGSRATIVE